jgi:hypothetical protein
MDVDHRLMATVRVTFSSEAEEDVSFLVAVDEPPEGQVLTDEDTSRVIAALQGFGALEWSIEAVE